MEAEWDEDEEREAPPKVDILLYTLSMVLWFRHLERPDELPNMCETLHLLGLVDRKYLEDEGVFSYTARPALLRLVYEAKGFFYGLRENKERGFITRKHLLAWRNAFKRKDDFE
jgi:hypothetical protein